MSEKKRKRKNKNSNTQDSVNLLNKGVGKEKLEITAIHSNISQGQHQVQNSNNVKANEIKQEIKQEVKQANVNFIEIFDDRGLDPFECFLEDKQLEQQENIKTDFVKKSFHTNKDKTEQNISSPEVKSNINLTARMTTSVSMNFKQIERKFIGHLTRNGERSKALRVWLKFLVLLKRHFYNSPVKCTVQEIILVVIDTIKPLVILKERKIAGTVYQIPYFVQNVTKDNATLIAIRWLVESMELRLENDPAERLYKEFLDVLKEQGICYKKKQDIYATAIKNRVYAKFLFLKPGKKRNI